MSQGLVCKGSGTRNEAPESLVDLSLAGFVSGLKLSCRQRNALATVLIKKLGSAPRLSFCNEAFVISS